MPTMPVVVHPLPLEVLRAYLISRPSITTLVPAARISDRMPPATASPRWPALRLTEVSSFEVVPRRLTRAAVQVDAWAADQVAADRLARIVEGELRASANWSTSSATLGETTELAIRPAPDTTLTPAQPRAIVTGQLWIQPRP